MDLRKCLHERKTDFSKVYLDEEKDEINWEQTENSIYPRFYCAKVPTMSLVDKARSV